VTCQGSLSASAGSSPGQCSGWRSELPPGWNLFARARPFPGVPRKRSYTFRGLWETCPGNSVDRIPLGMLFAPQKVRSRKGPVRAGKVFSRAGFPGPFRVGQDEVPGWEFAPRGTALVVRSREPHRNRRVFNHTIGLPHLHRREMEARTVGPPYPVAHGPRDSPPGGGFPILLSISMTRENGRLGVRPNYMEEGAWHGPDVGRSRKGYRRVV
jgi:hypothetical protein